jgi:uncharacterized membrane protein YkvA (DUF1232 family)
MTEENVREMEVSLQTRAEPAQQPVVERLKIPVRRLFREFRLIRRALVHPQVPWYAKLVAGCAVLYVVSPIQVLPNFVPIVGQMDDVLVVTLAIKFLRRFVPRSVLEECEVESRTPMTCASIPNSVSASPPVRAEIEC